MPPLAQHVVRAKPSAIMVTAEKVRHLKAAGRDIIDSSIGMPNFLPGGHVYAAARESLSLDYGQYSNRRGSDSIIFGKCHGDVLIDSDVTFCAALLESKGVACVPRSAFGEPRAYTCPLARLAPWLTRITAFFHELR